jgi:hypothetical protein
MKNAASRPGQGQAAYDAADGCCVPRTQRSCSPDAAQRAVLHGVVRCRSGAVQGAGVSVRSRLCEAALRAASRPGNVSVFYNCKQPCRFVLAAQGVRGLSIPRENLREGMEQREAPGYQRVALEAGLTYPPRAAKAPRAPSDVGRGASRRSTFATSSSAVPGRPGPASFRSVRQRIASRKRPLVGQDTSRISEV